MGLSLRVVFRAIVRMMIRFRAICPATRRAPIACTEDHAQGYMQLTVTFRPVHVEIRVIITVRVRVRTKTLPAHHMRGQR